MVDLLQLLITSVTITQTFSPGKSPLYIHGTIPKSKPSFAIEIHTAETPSVRQQFYDD